MSTSQSTAATPGFTKNKVAIINDGSRGVRGPGAVVKAMRPQLFG